MFDKIKDIAGKNFGGDSVSVEDGTERSDGDGGFAMKLKAAGADLASKAKDFSVFDKVKGFTASAVKTVEEIDSHLLNTRSQYEINNFRVSSTAGVTAGLTLDIHFTKNSVSKELAAAQSKFLTVVNPKSGAQIKVPVTALAGKETAKIKDPNTGEILEINTKTGEIIK